MWINAKPEVSAHIKKDPRKILPGICGKIHAIVQSLLGRTHTSDQSWESQTPKAPAYPSQERDPVLITNYLSLIVTKMLRWADNQQMVRSILTIPKEISISDIWADFQKYVELQSAHTKEKTYQYEWDKLLKEDLEISQKLRELIK